MTGFNRILVPLDGSERAEAALSWLQILPTRHLLLLRVCPPANGHGEDAAAYLTEVAARLGPPQATIEIRVVHDGAAEGIVVAAADADLVVMCTQGAGNGGRLLYGSVADRVARHAPAPTLLVRGGRDPIAATPVRRIVAPLDGSLAAERALPMAKNLASILAAPLHLVTIDESDGVDPPGEDAEVRNDFASRTYVEQKADGLASGDLIVTTERRCGVPADELIDMVAPGDLLVITTHGRGSARRWQIGRVAEKLLRHAGAPIVLIRADSL